MNDDQLTKSNQSCRWVYARESVEAESGGRKGDGQGRSVETETFWANMGRHRYCDGRDSCWIEPCASNDNTAGHIDKLHHQQRESGEESQCVDGHRGASGEA